MCRTRRRTPFLKAKHPWELLEGNGPECLATRSSQPSLTPRGWYACARCGEGRSPEKNYFWTVLNCSTHLMEILHVLQENLRDDRVAVVFERVDIDLVVVLSSGVELSHHDFILVDRHLSHLKTIDVRVVADCSSLRTDCAQLLPSLFAHEKSIWQLEAHRNIRFDAVFPEPSESNRFAYRFHLPFTHCIL